MTAEIDEDGVEIAGYDVRIDVDDLRLLRAEIERLRAEVKRARVEGMEQALDACSDVTLVWADECRDAIRALIDKEVGE